MNKPSWISPNEVLKSRLINTVYHLLVYNNRGEGRGGGLKIVGGGGAYSLSSPGAYLSGGGGGLNRAFTYCISRL